MKLITLAMVLVFSTTSIAAPKAEPLGRESRRGRGEISAKLVEKVDALNATARSVLGRNVGESFEIKIPENMSRSEMKTYEQKIEEFTRTLRDKESELVTESQKANEVGQLLLALNNVYSFRPVAKNFLDNTRPEGAAKEAVEDAVKLIDNLMVVMEVKLLETAESPVSYGQILRVMNLLAGMKVTGLKGQDFIELEAQITGILPKNYTMAKAARCVK